MENLERISKIRDEENANEGDEIADEDQGQEKIGAEIKEMEYEPRTPCKLLLVFPDPSTISIPPSISTGCRR